MNNSPAAAPSLSITECEQLQAATEKVLQLAKSKGASAADAAANLDQGLSVTVRLGDVETVELHRDRGLNIAVYFGQSRGSASTTDLSIEALTSTVEAACAIASQTSPDPAAGLADPERMATDIKDLDVWHPWALDTQTAIEIGHRCETAARDADTRISNSEGATVNSHQGIRVYANSHGFIGTEWGTGHGISCSLLAGAGDAMQRDYWYSSALDASDLDTPEAVGMETARRTVARLGARGVRTGQAPVLFAAPVARGLLGHFISAISGGALYRRASFLLDRVDTQVFSPAIELIESPHMLKASGSANFDNEGVATQPRTLVEAGVLQGYVLGSYSARKLGLETTANAGGVRNLCLKSTTGDLQSMLHQMGTGLLVTELMGQGVNGVTGDYSRGASGFWIENGVVAWPVQEITIAGNLDRMFQNIVAVGDDIDKRGNIRCGSILIDEMMIAGE